MYVEVALQHNDSFNDSTYSFVNNIITPEGGTHLAGFRNALTKTFNAYARANKILKDSDPALTGDDVFFCVLSLLCCSKTVVMELMDATSDALKTRKNRIKNKMDAQIFERVFGVDNQ